MTDTPKRQMPKPSAPAIPRVSEDDIKAVAAETGFIKDAPMPAPVQRAPQYRAKPRRSRELTGRDTPFTVKLRLDTLEEIYSRANERNIPVAQVIEEAFAALNREERRGD